MSTVEVIRPGRQGAVGINWRDDVSSGAWLTGTAYAVRDGVRNGSPASSYRCILAHTSGASTEPGVGAIWATYWKLLAEKGATGSVGPAGEVTGPADSVDGEVALFNGNTGKVLKRGSTEAQLKARGNHTGTQLAATISDFAAAVAVSIAAAVGVTVQAYSANLDGWAALSPASRVQSVAGRTGAVVLSLADISDMSANGRSLAAATYAGMRSLLDLEVGTDFYSITAADAAFQTKHTNLTAFAGLSLIADRLPYANGAGTLSLATFTGFGRSIVDDADAAAARTTLGVVIGTDVQAQDAELAAIAGLTSAADRLPYFTGLGTASLATFTTFGRSLVDDADAAAGRSTLGLVIGTDVQAFDADLSTWAGITPASGVGTFLATPSSANLLAAMTTKTGTGSLVFATSPTLVTPVIGAATGTSLSLSGGLTLATGQTLDWSGDLYLQRDAANILAQRNATAAQEFRVYNSWSGAGANYERGIIKWSGNFLQIGTDKGGTGSSRSVIWQADSQHYFYAASLSRMELTTTLLYPSSDLGLNFGDATHRWQDAYINRDLFRGGGAQAIVRTTAAITSGAGAGAGTLTNAPSAGNPTCWIPINDNGTTRYIPAW